MNTVVVWIVSLYYVCGGIAVVANDNSTTLAGTSVFTGLSLHSI